MNPSGTIVVGVDGSPESGAAIEFAMREAMRRGAWLRVVAAAHLPEYWTIAYGTADLPSPEEVIADTKRIARETLDEVVNAHPELAAAEFNLEAIAGPPGPVLVEASEGADLLVLGHRGRGAPAQRPARIRRTALRPARNLPGHRRPARRRHRADAAAAQA